MLAFSAVRVVVLVLVLGAAVLAPPAAAASSSPSPPPAEGDTRSSGEGAGFVGQPLVAIGGVVAVAVIAAAATLAYVRLTSRREG